MRLHEKEGKALKYTNYKKFADFIDDLRAVADANGYEQDYSNNEGLTLKKWLHEFQFSSNGRGGVNVMLSVKGNSVSLHDLDDFSLTLTEKSLILTNYENLDTILVGGIGDRRYETV